jgi:CRISP-associated protein Cas1
MLKRTLLIQNPCHLKVNNEQLIISFNHIKGQELLEEKTVPLEDIGVLILEHKQISLTHWLLDKCMYYNIALVCTNETHHPTGLLLNLDGNVIQSEKFKHQIAASEPLKKQLWQQVIISKIKNQAAVLQQFGVNNATLLHYAKAVKSGDTENAEGSAAAHYWQNLFPKAWDFYRRRDGLPPNNLLNYGYAIIRAITARALVASGLMPTLGIFHRNRYNAYCLADDIMEPYRPFVDKTVRNIIKTTSHVAELTKDFKVQLLSIAQEDVQIDGVTSPLLNAIQRTANSLAKCYAGSARKLALPELCVTND